MPSCGYIEHMPQANWVIVLHFVALWGSIITSLAAGWRIPVPFAVSIPLGILLWVLGLLYNVSTIKRHRRDAATHWSELGRRGYHRLTARTIMNLGAAVAFRSWLTLIVSVILIPFYATAARRRQRYLDYMRTGVLSDAFPDRIVKH
jgi:MFS family permease